MIIVVILEKVADVGILSTVFLFWRRSTTVVQQGSSHVSTLRAIPTLDPGVREALERKGRQWGSGGGQKRERRKSQHIFLCLS